MITIIHGDDIVHSRKFLIDEKGKSSHAITFSGSNLGLTDLAQALEGDSLFDLANKEIFIEDFFSKKQSREFNNIASFLQKHSNMININIWESKTLSKSQLSIFKNQVIKLFALPKSLFLFLEAIKPQNGKKLIALFHKTLETTEPELIFFMITRQLRLLLALSSKPRTQDLTSGHSGVRGKSTTNQIDELARLAPWQKSKLQKQAGLFSVSDLKNIFNKICSIEISQKTGSSILSLPQAIDFLLLSI